MKRENGTGTIVNFGKNRRRPYAVRIVTGWTDEGKAIYKYLTDENGEKYFAKRKQAEEVLYNYNKEKGNINIEKNEYTFKEVYEEYSQKYFPNKEEIQIEKETHQKIKGKFGISTTNNLKSAYKKCSNLYNKLYKSIKKSDFEEIINNTIGCATVINSLANLFRKLDDYALENDIIVKGYANLIKINDDMYTPVKNDGIPYTYEEIKKINNCIGLLEADITLCTIYTGARIEELLFTKISDIYIENEYFIAGLKTNAGKRRIIPIHSHILPIIKYYYEKNKNNEFLFTINDKKIDYNSQFLKLYRKFMKKLNMEHKTHDGRKTLHSELDRLNINKVIINKIFGHKSGNIGDDVYSKKSLEELKEAIEKVDYLSKTNIKLTYKIV